MISTDSSVRKPILDQIRDRADLQLVAPREPQQIVAARHRAVVVQDLDDHGRGLETREPREIAAGLRMAGAREHAAGLRHQREDVAGLTQVVGSRLGRDRGEDRARAIVRRDAGRHAFGGLDRDREVRRLAQVRVADHQRQTQLLAALARERQADQAAPVTRHEVHVLGPHLGRGHDEIALVLAILVVEDHDHLAAANRGDDVFGGIETRPGRVSFRARSHVVATAPCRRPQISRPWPRRNRDARDTGR